MFFNVVNTKTHFLEFDSKQGQDYKLINMSIQRTYNRTLIGYGVPL